MTGLSRITERISGDAKKENDALLAQAQKDADEIIAGYKKQAEDQTEDVVPNARKTAAERTERRLAVAAMEARKLQLAAKQNVIQNAFDEAAALLVKLDDAKKTEWLSKLASKYAVTGDESIILSTAEHATLGDKVVKAANKLIDGKGKLTLAPEGRDFPGGLVLSGGDVEINCTIAALLGGAREELAAEVGKICGVM